MPATYKEKVLLALSGGVDSSVAIKILQDKGYDVSACVIEFSEAHTTAVADAKKVADKYGIDLTVVSAHDIFKTEIIDYFADSYLRGITPNPCIKCNPLIKFKLICDVATKMGIEKIATGHYAEIKEIDGKYYIARAKALAKDQSYMLYRLDDEIKRRVLFPLNNIDKANVREIARSINLENADKPDSQEVCFIPDNDYIGFIERNYGKAPKGNFISPEGEICGTHQGIHRYTIGQRKGLGIALCKPCYIEKFEGNDIYLSFNKETVNPVIELYDMVDFGIKDKKYQAKIRSTGKLVPCKVKENKVYFDGVLTAITPGQSCVIYDEDIVIGGGIIRG